MRTLPILAVLFLGASTWPAVSADSNVPRPARELPEIRELPNPFRFCDGSPVRSQGDWERRRWELKSLFQDYEYGHLPPKAKRMIIQRGDPVTDAESKVTIQNLELRLEQADRRLVLHVRVAVPQNANGPAPVVVRGGFGKRGGGTSGSGGGQSPDAPSGKRFLPFARRGYAVAELDLQEVAIDNSSQARTAGVYQLFVDQLDCGSLMAWAWGIHRVIDALESLDKIDAQKIIVTGHSRYGKAALLAGAFDERIALTVPSHSGCAGVAPYRFIYGKAEQLHNIVGFAPYWFRPGFNQFVGNVARLPVDQHLLLALVAPRALLSCEGTQDAWTNPEGAQLSYLAARKVYALLQADGKISIRYRAVGHIPNNDDLLDYADHVFFNKPLSREFGKLRYQEERTAFPWAVPK